MDGKDLRKRYGRSIWREIVRNCRDLHRTGCARVVEVRIDPWQYRAMCEGLSLDPDRGGAVQILPNARDKAIGLDFVVLPDWTLSARAG